MVRVTHREIDANYRFVERENLFTPFPLPLLSDELIRVNAAFNGASDHFSLEMNYPECLVLPQRQVNRIKMADVIGVKITSHESNAIRA